MLLSQVANDFMGKEPIFLVCYRTFGNMERAVATSTFVKMHETKCEIKHSSPKLHDAAKMSAIKPFVTNPKRSPRDGADYIRDRVNKFRDGVNNNAVRHGSRTQSDGLLRHRERRDRFAREPLLFHFARPFPLLSAKV